MSNLGATLLILLALLTLGVFGWMFYDLNYKTTTYDASYESTVTIVEKYENFIISSNSEKYRFDNVGTCFAITRVGQTYNFTLQHRPYDDSIFIRDCHITKL